MWNQQREEFVGGQFQYGQVPGAACNVAPPTEDLGNNYGEAGFRHGVGNITGQTSNQIGNAYAYEGGTGPSQGLHDGGGRYSGQLHAYAPESVSYGAHGERAENYFAYTCDQGQYGQSQQHGVQAFGNGERNFESKSHKQPSRPPVSYEPASAVQPVSFEQPVSYEHASAVEPIAYDHTASRLPTSSSAGVSELDSMSSGKVFQKPETGSLEQKAKSSEAQSRQIHAAPVSKSTLLTKKKTPGNAKPNGPRLAFGFKSASKVKVTINPLKAALEIDELEREEAERKEEEEREAKRQKLGIAPPPSDAVGKTPPAPTPAPEDPEVRRIAEKLAKFVAKNGRGLENTTRQKNPGDTPFRFLFDPSSLDYKYYEYCIGLEEKALQETAASNAQAQQEAGPPPAPQPQAQPVERRRGFSDAPPPGRPEPSGISSSQDDKLSQEDSLAKMEFYARQAARANAGREPRGNTREMPPPEAEPEAGGRPPRGHHMGDFIPEEALQTFLSKTNPGAKGAPPEDRNKIGASNVGHKLLSKMGWTEGSGLGAGGSGMVDPLAAGGAKLDGLGVGAAQTHEPTASDDIYEQYKKRMMLGYKHRPNPLGNPRKAYY